MRRLKNFAWATEIKSIVENENKCKFVIEELEKIIGLKFNLDLPNGAKLTFFNVITTVLLGSDYAEYRNILLELLKHYNVNERALLFHLIGVVSQINKNLSEKIMDNYRNQLISSFSLLPYHQNITWDDRSIIMETKYGKIEVYRYDKIVKNPEVYKIIRTTNLENWCHSVVQDMRFYYPEDDIITSEIPLLFGGDMYHSYFATKDGVLDITNNMFFQGGCFNEVFKPKEMLRVKSSEFSEKYGKIITEKDIVDDGSIAPVLALALNNKMKL